MKKEYLAKEIEIYVQKHWEKNNTFQVKENCLKEKYYCLPMLPYPSGKLHIGHIRNYTISDIISRYQRMLGKNVLQPIGWDAFGLPAEEAAIKNNVPPSSWTYKNIKYMKKQLKSLGFSYDWSREITTCKPEYYHWEQWFFIQLFKKKLVYKKNSLVNWCPIDKTVLANEQVIDGCCWRCQSEVIMKNISQWFIKIRKYAEPLYQDLKKLKHWPKQVKIMQKNWIGRKKGFEIIFDIFQTREKIKVFSTRLDTLMGCTYISISPNHVLAIKESRHNLKIKKFIKFNNYENCSKKEIEQKKYEGINTNLLAIHPLTEKKIPIWIANFVIDVYGTDAIISVPAHNQYDWHFSAKNNLPIQHVIKNTHDTNITSYNEKKGILFNSKYLNNLNFEESTEKIKTILLLKNVITEKIHYKLKDWCVSRQRFWGTPIPMTTFKNNNIIPVPNDKLPVLLYDKNIIHNQLHNENIKPHNQNHVKENDTFDTFIESSWYYARYTSPNFKQGMIDPKASKYWLPVDQYIGGIEHATMHLIYIRFFHKLLRDFKLVNCDEPVKKLICQGMVLAETFYYLNKNGQRQWIDPSNVLVKRNKKGEIVDSHTKKKEKVIYAGMIKMSKSKKNGIDPESVINQYGADTIRLFIIFAAPIETDLEWNDSGIKGIYRFLNKIWNLTYNYIQNTKKYHQIKVKEFNNKQTDLLRLLHQTIKKVSDDISRRQTFNTAISEIMKLVNQLRKISDNNIENHIIIKQSLIAIIKMLYPFTPHICFILWENLCKKKSIDEEKWPTYNKDILVNTVINFLIQINGKTKCIIKINENCTKEQIILIVKKQKIIQIYENKINFNNIIYIPKKIINFIISKT